MIRAVFIDALGTLVALRPPWELLADAVPEADPADLRRAVEAEMRYYKDHCDEGRDAQSLAALRQRSAEVLSAELGHEVDAETLMRAIRFDAYPDAAPALQTLRARGLALLAVSNWDISLAGVLDEVGLLAGLDGVVTSAAARARKPDPAIFRTALHEAGVRAAEALHVGDSAEEDVAGARAAGIRPLLIDREGGGDIGALTEIERLL
ncbi:MAG: HAD family hydrolase [Solirubrobacterales bacterium]